MIDVKYIPNILSADNHQKIQFKYSRDMRMSDYIKLANFPTDGMRFILSGKVQDNTNVLIDNGDEIIVTPDVQWPALVAIGKFIWAWGALISAVVSVGMSIYSAVTYKKPVAPSYGSGDDGSSPTYGWDGIQTTQDVGLPVAITYGTHKMGGNIINSYVRTDGDKNYLNVLLALCEGEIDDITDIKINDQPVANYDGVTSTEKYGTNAQTVIPNFGDLHNMYSLSQNLNVLNDTYTYTTVNTDVEAFEIYLTLPGGLYSQLTDGSLAAYSVTYTVEYKVHTDGSYTSLGTQTISGKSRTSLRRIYRKDGLTAGQYDIKVTRTSAGSTTSTQADLSWTNVDEIKTDDLAYPNTALLGIEAMATDQLSGNMPQFSCIVRGKKVSIPDVKYSGNSIGWDDYYWDPTASSYKRFSDDAACTWDGTSYITAYSANPIWCLKDLLTNTRLGLGDYVTSSMFNASELVTMSKYCEERVPDGSGGYEKRFRMDMVIDSQQRVPDLMAQIASVCRGLIFFSENTVKIKIDKPDTAVQLFGMGNIINGSFQQQWKSLADIPNMIEVQYLDATKNYQQEMVAVIDEDAIAAGTPLRKKQIRVYTTKMSYAIREGRYALKVNKYLDRSITFKAGIDAVACQPADRIDIAHDVPQWGFSGRVAAGSTTTRVELDQTITLDGAKSYKVQVRLSNDTIEERTVTNGAGSYNYVTVSAAFSATPAAYDVYSVGEVSKVTKPFRISSWKINNTNEVDITAVEYDELTYDDTAVTIPTDNYSALSLDIPDVEYVNLTEGLVKLNDGTIENVIDVWFRRPAQGNFVKMYAKAKVYLSDNSGTTWQYKGEATGESFQIIGGLTDGVTYRVAVVSVSDFGQSNPIADAPYDTITLVGKSAAPSDVSTFLVNQSRDRMFFGWTHVTDVDLSGYEIRYGDSWSVGKVIASNIKSNNLIILDFRTSASAQSYWIKAMDTSGNYSDTAKQAAITISDIPFTNVINSYSEQTGWSGTKVDCSKVGDNLELDTGKLTGTYETAVKDQGYIATFKVGIEEVITQTGDRRFDSDASVEFDDSATDRFSGGEVFGSATFQIKTSDDNSTWSSYTDWQAADYACRYFQIKMTLTRASTDITLQCSQLNYYSDLPDVDEFGSDSVSSAGDGKAVTFSKTFHEEPSVHIEITSGSGIYSQFTAKDTTGFTVKLYNAAGTAQTGDFDYHGHGV